MAASTNQISLALFNYMCQHVVGTEKAVKMKRVLNTVENITECRCFTKILSGSLGEGLEMVDSDRDYMYVETGMRVFEDITTIQFDPAYIHSVFVMEDTKAGFTKLRLKHTYKTEILDICEEVDGVLYLSNLLYKLSNIKNLPERDNFRSAEVIHGPCLSDIAGIYDNAFCVHCKSWISSANQWITRHRGMWPDVEVMSKIIDHGVLFVPVGCKGSPNEDIEWRISFSVGEKLLIYSFTHTQLLCYALMKILLKDVINRDNGCKDLLCSYFIKTILFWISEEIPVAMWRSENLIPCFMQCVNRLLYCVKYSMCPHYFIHDKNLFESKIDGERRTHLLEKLKNIVSLDWRCIFLSEQLQTFHIDYNVLSNTSQSFANTVTNILSSSIHFRNVMAANCMTLTKRITRFLQHITVWESSRLRLMFLYWFSRNNLKMASNLSHSKKDGNKALYKQYKEQLCCILQSLYHDAGSGWLFLASVFYKMKQYNLTIYVLSHVLHKCSTETKLCGTIYSSREHPQILHLNYWERKGVLHTYVKVGIWPVNFRLYIIPLIPEKIKMTKYEQYGDVPPIEYAHFLSCLCHYHHKDVRRCYNSLRNLLLSITEHYTYFPVILTAVSYNMYVMVLKLVGEHEAARRVYFAEAHILMLIKDAMVRRKKKVRIPKHLLPENFVV